MATTADRMEEGACHPVSWNNAEAGQQPASKGKQDAVVRKAEQAPKSDRFLLFILCACSTLEGADSMLFRAVFFALQRDLGLTLGDLATMTLFQALAQALAAPFWGVLADRRVVSRKSILVFGSLAQGIVTAVLAGVDQNVPMTFLRALNGAMLASLRPISNGIVADITSEENRGRVFGWLLFSMNLGMVAGSIIGAPLSTRSVGGLQGWRAAFIGVGIIGVVVGILVAIFMKEPQREPAPQVPAGKKRHAIVAEALRIWGYLKMPTFCAMVMQGCFGCIPWNALGYQILFFQVGGLGDLEASVLQAASQVASALGNLLGGLIGDSCAKRCRLHGRPFTAQVSVLSGIPIAWCIFMVPVPEHGAFVWYLVLSVLLGLMATWCATGVNWPILSEIVSSDGRSAIMAWQSALEGACAAVFGNAAVGILAEKVFGYNLSSANSGSANPENMRALGKALMWSSFVPWIICFCFYTMLHWSYPRDLRRVQQQLEMQPQDDCCEAEVPQVDDRKSGKSSAGPGFPRLSTAASAAAATMPEGETRRRSKRSSGSAEAEEEVPEAGETRRRSKQSTSSGQREEASEAAEAPPSVSRQRSKELGETRRRSKELAQRVAA